MAPRLVPLRYDLIHAPPGTDATVRAQRVMDLRRVVLADADGNLVLGGETTPLASNVLTYTSQVITQADLTTGATKVLALASPPTAMLPVGCYVITTGGPVASNNGSTTGLAVEVGVTADPDSLMKSVSVFGTAGRKGGARGDDLNSFRSADALEIKFTATGGAPNVTHITGLSLRVVLLYIKAPV